MKMKSGKKVEKRNEKVKSGSRGGDGTSVVDPGFNSYHIQFQ